MSIGMKESADESDLECLSSPSRVSLGTRSGTTMRTEDDLAAV